MYVQSRDFVDLAPRCFRCKRVFRLQSSSHVSRLETSEKKRKIRFASLDLQFRRALQVDLLVRRSRRIFKESIAQPINRKRPSNYIDSKNVRFQKIVCVRVDTLWSMEA